MYKLWGGVRRRGEAGVAVVVVVQTITARLMCAYVEKSVENVEKKFFLCGKLCGKLFSWKISQKRG